MNNICQQSTCKCEETRKTMFFEVTTRSILSTQGKPCYQGRKRGIWDLRDQQQKSGWDQASQRQDLRIGINSFVRGSGIFRHNNKLHKIQKVRLNWRDLPTF